MLNFLRKLRRNNINSKYLKYAVGEVLLVVIGILIAFQVNEWRDNQRQHAKEKKSLELLINDLNNERDIFIEYQNRIDYQEKAIIALLKGVSEDAPKDSLLKYAFRATNLFMYRTNHPTFDGMRQNGELALIRNDSLRNAVVGYFDSRISYLNNLQTLVTDNNNATITALNPYFGYEFNSNKASWELSRVNNLGLFKNDHSAINNLSLEGNNLDWLSYRLGTLFIPENENLAESLKTYLLEIK